MGYADRLRDDDAVTHTYPGHDQRRVVDPPANYRAGQRALQAYGATCRAQQRLDDPVTQS